MSIIEIAKIINIDAPPAKVAISFFILSPTIQNNLSIGYTIVRKAIFKIKNTL